MDLTHPAAREHLWRALRALRDAPVPDVEAIGARGMAFERLDQLALEHLYGIRS